MCRRSILVLGGDGRERYRVMLRPRARRGGEQVWENPGRSRFALSSASFLQYRFCVGTVGRLGGGCECHRGVLPALGS